MIISQTPFRVSFFGGGTDLPQYYSRYEGGAVFSVTIDKYVYVIVKKRYDDKIVLHHSKREESEDLDQIEHGIVREALKIAGIKRGIEILSISDVPSIGSGLGSSSSFAVGLLSALFAYKGEHKSPAELAKLACEIEIGKLNEPIGKQDQYAAAFGGFKKYHFNSDESVSVSSMADFDHADYNFFSNHSMMFYTGITRKASMVLADQKNNIDKTHESLHKLKEYALNCDKFFMQRDVEKIGEYLHKSWEEKKKLSSKINNNLIDNMYDLAMNSGAFGGKILGAGGGGFLYFLCPMEKQQNVRAALSAYKEMPINFDKFGNRIVLNIKDTCSFINNSEVFLRNAIQTQGPFNA